MGHHRFDPDNAAKLDSEARLDTEPPAAIVEALALEPGCMVLDLGSGTGTYALPVARRLAELGGGAVLCADVEPRLLAMITERAQGLDTVVPMEIKGAPPYPLGDASVDRALLVHVFHELDDPAATVCELDRVLADGGQVLIVDWDPAHVGESGPPAAHRVPVDEAVAHLHGAGFDQVERLELFTADFYTLRATRSP